MNITKGGQKFKLLNLNVSLQNVVDTFLSTETGAKFPISFSESEDIRPKLMGPNRMAMSISQNLRGHLDIATQGLSFFIGPVNSKLCYKMSVCDLSQLQKIFSSANGRCLMGKRPED